MKVKDFKVRLVDRSDIKDFVESNHYSKSINGLMSSYCFGLFNGDDLIGAMIYGKLAMANAYKKYGNTQNEVIELRRLCCIDDTPKNTESYFIGATLRWLKKNTDVKVVVSYADPAYGHQGVIYKASNFKLTGKTSKSRVIMLNGKKYHDKTIRTKYKGKLKPFAQRVKDALGTGEAYYEDRPPKNIYEYRL